MENIKNDAVACPESQSIQEAQEGVGIQSKIIDGEDLLWNISENETEKGLKETKPSPHSKKVMKHALRQQAKRRRKNTTIAAGNPAPIQRHTLSANSCEIEEVNCDTACYRQPTMAEVLASIPGFSMKPRKRSQKKLSAAAQLEQTKEGCVDLETPDSILVNSNLRSLLNKHTFSSLPSLYQYKLLQLLPHVDRTGNDSVFRLSGSGLTNEFFARACLDWRERLAEGEFTPENQAKNKAEQEKEKSKLDPWKLKHFEPTWGESLREWPTLPASTPTAQPKQQQQHQSKPPKQSPPPPITRVRTVGAVTRAVTSYREKRAALSPPRLTDPKRSRQSDPEKPETKIPNDPPTNITVEETIIPLSEPKTEITIESKDKYEEDREVESQSGMSTSTDDVLDGPCESFIGKTKSEIDYIILPRTSPSKDKSESESQSDDTRTDIEESHITVSYVSDTDTIQAEYKCSEPSPKEIMNSPSRSPEIEPEESISLISGETVNTNVPTSSSEELESKAEMSCTNVITETESSSLGFRGDISDQNSTGKFTEEAGDKADEVNFQKTQSEDNSEQCLSASEPPEKFGDSQILEPQTSIEDEVEVANNKGLSEIEMSDSNQDKLHHTEIVQDHVDLNMAMVHNDIISENERSSLVMPKEENNERDLINQNQLLQHNQNEMLHPQVFTQRIEQNHVHQESVQSSHHVAQDIRDSQFHQQLQQSRILHQHIDQSQLIHQQNNQSQIHQQQIDHNQFLQSIDHSQYIQQQTQHHHHQQQMSHDQILQGQVEPSKILHQQIDQRGNLQHIDQNRIQQRMDSLMKSNVLMMPQVVLDVQQVPTSNATGDHSGIVNPVKEEGNISDMNAVITIPASNEQSLTELRVVNSAMSNVSIVPEMILPDVPGNTILPDVPANNILSDVSGNTIMPDVPGNAILSDVSGNAILPDRPNIDEKWEVIQVNPEKNEEIYFKENEAAILAAAWDVVGSSTHFQDLQPPVSVIPCQEEIEVRLQESSLPAPQWVDYTNSSDKQSTGHVKLELEVTLTPEVDSHVSSSSADGGGDPVRVIPPTTIVCLPPLTASAPHPPPPPPATSSAIPYLALTTSTPVRAIPTKPLQSKSGGRGGRGANNKPPPGAVNFERSYQICQAVIQNSPNRHQLRCLLKPPPALLNKKQPQVSAPINQQQRQKPRQPTVVLRHMITSNTGGIPVSMAVLPSHPSHVGGVRRSNSAPPSNSESQACGGRGRPASVGGPGLSCGGCSLRPLVPCRRCGDFCHEDCITPSRLCVTCHSA